MRLTAEQCAALEPEIAALNRELRKLADERRRVRVARFREAAAAVLADSSRLAAILRRPQRTCSERRPAGRRTRSAVKRSDSDDGPQPAAGPPAASKAVAGHVGYASPAVMS
jgi:hypothetical protein